MLKAFFLALLLPFLGCMGTMEPRAYDFPSLPPGLKVLIYPSRTVNHICRAGKHGNGKRDDGTMKMNGDQVFGCFIPPGLIILSEWHPEYILHEFCHASGRSKKECSGVRW